MGVFDRLPPPPPREPRPRIPRPPWMKPPTVEARVIAARMVLAHTPEAAVVGIAESRAEIATEVILQAAAQALPLWPHDDESG